MHRISMLIILLSAVFIASLSFAENNAEYYYDRLILRIDKSAGEVAPLQTPEGCRFGIPGLDDVCERIGAVKIEKLIPWSTPPEDEGLVDMSRVYIVYFTPEFDLFEAIEAFAAQREVVYAEPRYIRKMFFTPNDPLFGNQWGLDNFHTQAENAFDYCQGDSTVSISIVDSGMDMDHPDLVGNLWVNPGEDLNGNGIIDLEDWNYIDDDGNGFIDDFWGWDFMDNDNNPEDVIPSSQGGGHGTHCAGIASAETNNGVGVASLGFNCSIIPVRTGAGMLIYYGYEGIAYSISVDADVISLSWGGGGYSQAEQDLFDQAHALGIAVFAAAGNDNTSQIMYPAGYNHLFAVASTNSNDVKSGFSNFGTWIDISAPGSNIYSTYLGGSYTGMSGTSMACPFTAGLAGLVKSAFPDFTPDDIFETISITADNIYPMNPGYIGMLGAGRINAYTAIGPLYFPALSLDDYILLDDGNYNGRADPGENVDMIVTLSNLPNWQTATDIMAYLSCFEAGISVTQGQASFPDIPAGENRSNEMNPFEFSVSPDFVPQYVDFILSLICQPNNFTSTDTITMMVGRPDYLVVDDDGGVEFETYYLEPLDELGESYEYWDNSLSYLTSDMLNEYNGVIWFTGNQETFTLDAYEQSILQQYLESGGYLFLCGQYIGDEIGSSDFYADYLHAAFDNPNVGAGLLNGVEGNPISENTTVFLVGAGGAGNGLNSPSGIIPTAPAEPLYEYSNGVDIGALSCLDLTWNYKLVYMEFAFEAISGLGNPPSNTRTEILELIIDWFDFSAAIKPGANLTLSEFELYPNHPNPFNPATEISFSLPMTTNVELVIFDVLGREAAKLYSGRMNPGPHSLTFDGTSLASGVYFCSLKTDLGTKRIKMLLLK
ncbi:MAG: S8 family serine peptidase [candidate division Zixibacteria bacterium]|nr:S8 family serine peptidase [Candidatus Tariuqbacter arcticus]